MIEQDGGVFQKMKKNKNVNAQIRFMEKSIGNVRKKKGLKTDIFTMSSITAGTALEY